MRTLLVSGPPCAGKTTFILERMNAGDYILDRDRIEEALTGLPPEPCDSDHGVLVAAAFYGVLTKSRALPAAETLWVQECAPRRDVRRRYRDMNRASVFVLETDAETCKGRALERYGDDARFEEYCGVIDGWWRSYEPDSRDEIVVGVGV